MMTLAEVKKVVNGFYGINEVTVSVGWEQIDDDTTEYDVNINIWAYNKFYVEEFDSITRDTLTNEAKALAIAKRTATSLRNSYGDKIKFVGLENC